jgi:hypothetical protein
MKSFYPLLVLTAACGITHASPNARALEFAQGVIVDALHSVAYMSNSEARIDAISLSNGEVIATSTRGAKPLLLYDNILLAAAQDRIDALSVVGLRTKDLKLKFELELRFPVGPGRVPFTSVHGSTATKSSHSGDPFGVRLAPSRRANLRKSQPVSHASIRQPGA